MTYRKTFVLALALAIVALASADRADARMSRASRDAKAALASNVRSVASVQSEPIPAPCGGCCPAPCVTYRYKGCQDVCCGCEAPLKTVLQVNDPCTCCPIEVPVCLPGCCEGVPKVCQDRGLFGRHVVWYDWCCGFSVKVTFKKTGDIIVTYVGR